MWQFMIKQQKDLIINKPSLMINLSEFYERHLKQDLDLFNTKNPNLLQSIKTINIEAFATALP